MKYRPEIDGLRAVAVLSVIFFHSGIEIFSGGYVGVDIFLVISGYLITTIILSEKENRNFSLVNFYERRARRILPALFLVMSVSFVIAWFLLLPTHMKDFSKSLIAVSTFSSNILFWRETGYWGVENEIKPLLHTWSLSLEEQYYIIFPIFLSLVWKLRKRWILLLFMTITLLSLLLAQWGAYNRPVPTFFLLPTRAWELAIGGCIAFYFVYKNNITQHFQKYKKINEILTFVGFFLIIYSIFNFDSSTPFPSFYTLIPIIGTGLIIMFASKNTLIGRILSFKLIVGIGLLSYSAYLWHQPLFAFVHHYNTVNSYEELIYLTIPITFYISYISWKYIEQPFRNNKKFSRKSIFSFSVIGSLIFIAIGLAGYLTHGYEMRSSNPSLNLKNLEKRLNSNYGLSQVCDGDFTLSKKCKTSDKPEIVVWGDSFAMHLVQGIISSNPSVKLIQFTSSNCGPIFDIAPIMNANYNENWANNCLENNQKVRNWLQRNDSVKYVVISSPFNQYIPSSREGKLLTKEGLIKEKSTKDFLDELQATLSEIESMGITPVIISPPPSNNKNLGQCLTNADWRNTNLDRCNFKIKNMSSDRKVVYKQLESIKPKYNTIRIDKFLCNHSVCATHFNSTYFFRDSGHLSIEGSIYLGKKFDFYKLITTSQSNSNNEE